MIFASVIYLLLLKLYHGNEQIFHDGFDTKVIDEDAYQHWSRKTLREKLPYLIDERMKISLSDEFSRWMTFQQTRRESTDRGFSYETIEAKLSEFQTKSVIRTYFRECDVNRDEVIDKIEYIVCRGYYDATMNAHGQGEYDVLESIVIHDYEQQRSNPLIRQPFYKYDENGIIID